MEICRACLGSEGDLTPLNESLVTAYNLITNLNITLMDAMPQFTCESCLQAIKFCIDFREKCIETETSLQQVLEQKIKDEESNPLKLEQNNFGNGKIKQEIKEEAADDTVLDHCFDDDYSNLDDFNILMEKDSTEEVGPKKRKYIKKKKKSLKMLADVIIESCDNDVKPKKRKYTKKKTTPEEDSCGNDEIPKKRKYIKKEEDIKEIVIHPCGLCKELFANQEIMTKHVENHKNHRRCNLCSEEFCTWPALVGHRMAHLSQKQRRCHVCNMYIFSVNHGHCHYMKAHFDGEKTKLPCGQCSRSFENTRQLKKHTYHCHSNQSYVCDLCGKTATSKPLLKSHMLSHMEFRSYKCDICNFSSKTLSGLKDHNIRKHSPDKVKCIQCKRWFSSPEHMEKHKCSPTLRICPICGINVNYRLNKHLQSHSNVMPYKCERCPAAYKSPAALKDHLNRHDNLRTRQCEFCERKFFTASALIKHRRVHTGEKPYVCKICNRGFTGNYNLKIHMKVHGEDLVQKRIKPDIEPLVTTHSSFDVQF